MVRTKSSEGKKHKPRGRPFVRGNKRGKVENAVLDAPGLESSDERGNIAPDDLSTNLGTLKEGISHTAELMLYPPRTIENSDKVFEDLPIEGSRLISKGAGGKYLEMLDEQKDIENPLELIDEIIFINGTNTLKITLKKRTNRMYRIQIYLNDDTEIRNVTFNGNSTAISYWKMIKGILT